MSKHTPGPWRYIKQNGSPTTGQHMIAGATPGYLAEIRDCGSGDVEANATLVAAAPDLLDIAEQAIAAFGYLAIRATSKDDRDEFKRRENAAFAIVAKAKGA